MKMTHPDLGKDQKPAEVDPIAFEKVWKKRGWVEHDEKKKASSSSSS